MISFLDCPKSCNHLTDSRPTNCGQSNPIVCIAPRKTSLSTGIVKAPAERNQEPPDSSPRSMMAVLAPRGATRCRPALPVSATPAHHLLLRSQSPLERQWHQAITRTNTTMRRDMSMVTMTSFKQSVPACSCQSGGRSCFPFHAHQQRLSAYPSNGRRACRNTGHVQTPTFCATQ